MSKSTSFKNIQKILSKIFLTKVFFMTANIATYLIALQYFGGVFALAHASILLVMNIFKAGCSYYGIETGGGVLNYAKQDFLKRLTLAILWSYLLSIFTDISFFYISILGILISLMWLRAYDMHLKGLYLGSFMYSSIPIITTLVCMLSFSLKLNAILSFQYNLMAQIICIVILIFIFIKMSDKLNNLFSEMCNSSISPMLISFLVAQNFGDIEWIYIFAFKGYEAIAQISIFLLTATRNYKLSENKQKILCLVFFCTILLISTLINYHLQFDNLLILGSWMVFLSIYSYWFIRDENDQYLYFIFATMLIIFLGANYLEIFIINILMIHILLAILWIIYVSKLNKSKNTI